MTQMGLKSNLEKITESCKGQKAESINGRGYLFFTVMSFSRLSSIQGHKDLSFLSTKKNPALTGKEEGRMRPAAREPWMYFSMPSYSGLERLYSFLEEFAQSYCLCGSKDSSRSLLKTCIKKWFLLGTEERSMPSEGC